MSARDRIPAAANMRPTMCPNERSYLMGNITTTSKRPMRKATFERTEDGQFVPVNRRARERASEHVGEQATYTKADLKKIAKKGKVRVYVYTSAGLRKVV